MLVQHPAPAHIDFDAVLMAVDPDKDVDGMHPTNVGRLALGIPGPVSCTPAGIEAILAHYDVPVAGRDVVIVGRGVTIGRPLSILLSQKRPTANAAVTVVHTGVPSWADYTRRADVLVAAAGVPGMIQPEHVRPGGVVVGAGVRYEGRTLLPDVDGGVRGGRGLDHASGRRGRPDDHRDAVPQPRRGGGAPRRAGLMPGTLTALPALDIAGHQSSGLGSPEHPMRIMTRRAAGLHPGPWDDAARAEVAAFFDALAPEWHTRTSPERDAVVADALQRGVGDGTGEVCVELGSGIGAYTPVARGAVAPRCWRSRCRWRCSAWRRRDVGHRVLADGARLPLTAGAAERGRARELLPVPPGGRPGAGARRRGRVGQQQRGGDADPPAVRRTWSRRCPVDGRAWRARPGLGQWCVLRRAGG